MAWFGCFVLALLQQSPVAANFEVWRDPQGPAPLALGESNGFGHAIASIGGLWAVASPRSHRDAERAGEVWIAQRERPQPNRSLSGYAVHPWQGFGFAMAVEQSAQVLAVGAPLAPGDGTDVGHVSLFDWQAVPPIWQQTLVPTGTPPGAGFGSELTWQGGDLWVAAPYAHGPGGELQAGYLARFAAAGNRAGMVECERVYAPLPLAGLRFGTALVVTAKELIVGVPGGGVAGEVLVLPRNAAGLVGPQVLQAQTLRPPGAVERGDAFGARLELDASGEWLFVGSPGSRAQQPLQPRAVCKRSISGKVSVFRRKGTGPFVWQRDLFASDQNGLGSLGSQPSSGLQWAPGLQWGGFGQSMALADGVLWVGAPVGAGALFAFPQPWDAPLLAQAWIGPGERLAFGKCIVPQGLRCLVGAPGHGIYSERKPVRGRVMQVPRPVAHVVSDGLGGGLRWVGSPVGEGRALAWGLDPGEVVRIGWARGKRPSGGGSRLGATPWKDRPMKALRANSLGHAWLELTPPAGATSPALVLHRRAMPVLWLPFPSASEAPIAAGLLGGH